MPSSVKIGMYHYLIVFFGAGIGGILRHTVNQLSARLFGYDFPIGTLTVNVVGSLSMGLLVGFFALHNESLEGNTLHNWKLFLTTGLLGGFTTFSAFSLDAVTLYERGEYYAVTTYVLLSVVGAFAGVLLGMWLMRHLPTH